MVQSKIIFYLLQDGCSFVRNLEELDPPDKRLILPKGPWSKQLENCCCNWLLIQRLFRTSIYVGVGEGSLRLEV